MSSCPIRISGRQSGQGADRKEFEESNQHFQGATK